MADAALHQAATAQLHQDRAGGLSEHEIDALGDRLWARFERRFEALGWDMSSPEARDRIRDNNKWVDSWRSSAERAKTAATHAGILAFVSGLVILLWQAFKSAIVKGGG